MSHDSLRGLVLDAPGRAAPVSALCTLRLLALHDDPGAVLAISEIVATVLGLDRDAAVIRRSPTVADVVESAEVNPLVRFYTLGYVPRVLIADATRADARERAGPGEPAFERFRQLVRRGAVTQDEVLKAYILLGLANSIGLSEHIGILDTGAMLGVLDRIVETAAVVPGGNADTTFEFGRDAILGVAGSDHLMTMIYHEIGHHTIDAVWGRGDLAGGSGDEGVAAFARDLPGMLRAAVAAPGQPVRPGDPRSTRLPSGLLAICTWERLPGGTYTHLSFTAAAGPIAPEVAAAYAYLALTIAGVDPLWAVAVYSVRGVFHVGFRGEADLDQPPPVPAYEELAAAGADWLDSLERLGRLGSSEPEIRYLLVVQKRPQRLYGDDPNEAWADAGTCERIREGADLGGFGEEELAELLHAAVRHGDPVSVRRIVDAGSPSFHRRDAGLAQLGRSCCVLRSPTNALEYFGPTASDLLAVVAELHRAGFDIDTAVNDAGDTLLIDAADRGPGLVEGLLASGADPRATNNRAETALHRAAASASARSVDLLLRGGAPAEARDADGDTPLHHAAGSDCLDGARALLAAGAPAEAANHRGERPLARALSPAMAVLLCDAGVDPDARDHTGMTALMNAAAVGAPEIVRVLLRCGADPHAATDLGTAAVHYAAAANRVAAIDALLDGGADVDEETNEGFTALMMAAGGAHDAAVERLIARGANVDATTVDGVTALMFASDGRQQWNRDPTTVDRLVRCIRLLGAAGAAVDTADQGGRTALHFAMLGFSSEPVAALLELGADPNVADADGATPLRLARAKEHPAMVEDLLNAGAIDNTDRRAAGND